MEKAELQHAEMLERLADPLIYEATAKADLQSALLKKAQLEQQLELYEIEWLEIQANIEQRTEQFKA